MAASTPSKRFVPRGACEPPVTSDTYYWAGGRKVALERVTDPAGPSGASTDTATFRAEDGSLITVLPEVRVECEDPAVLDAVSSSLRDARVTQRTDERLVIEPTSGRGEDALALANHLAESFDLEVAQARFRRIIPRPGVEPSSGG